MIGSILALISITLILVLSFLFYQYSNNIQNNLYNVVDQVNSANMYGYQFDIQQQNDIDDIKGNIKKLKRSVGSNTMQISTMSNNISTSNLSANAVQFSNNSTLSDSNDGYLHLMNSNNSNGGGLSVNNLISQSNTSLNNLNISGSTSNLGNISVGGTGIISGLKVSKNWTGYPDGRTDGSEIANDTGGFKQLMIVGNKSGGGERRVGVWDTLNMNGTLNANGNIYQNGGQYYLNDRHIKIRGDENHGLGYDGSVDGPNLYGWAGGKLSTKNGNTALKWDNNGNTTVGNVTSKGNVTANGNLTSGGSICINNTCITQEGLMSIKKQANVS